MTNLNQAGNVCTNVTFRRVRVTSFAMEKQQVSHILSVFVSVALVT